MNQEQQKSYQKWCEELYKENQSFLNKAIFGVSSLAIPFLFEVLSRQTYSINSYILLGASLIGFCMVILLQISSLKHARDGCDEGIKTDQESIDKSIKKFSKARKVDIWKERIFVFSLFLTALTLLLTKFIN